MKTKITITTWAIAAFIHCCAVTWLAAQSLIPAKEVYTKAATAEKTYASYWVRNFQVRSTSATEGTFYIEVIPYDATTGELDQSAPIEYSGNLWELMGAKPSAAKAMGAVNAAIPDVEAFVLAKAAQSNP
jgi:hypothetical protein